MKNLSKVLALVLVVAMVFSLAVSAGAAASFKDSASVNYGEAVQLLAALDVLNGYDTDGDGKGDTFKPGANITRAELTVMLSYLVANEDAKYGLYNDINKLNKDYKSLCTFADSKNEWAAGFIAFCYGNGYISGRDADTFDPNGDVTVAEATVMLLRVMGYDAAKEEFGTSKGTVKGYNLQLTARNAGLLEGLDDVDFFAPATREQVAQLFMNALDSYTVYYNVAGVRYNAEYTYKVNTTEFKDYEKLVNVCFQHVLKVDTTNEFGLAGHQWVTYPNATVTKVALTNATLVTYTGAAGKLTDVVVDDTALATFVGGTSYGKIAAQLGLTSATSPVPCVVYVNGAPVVNGAVGSANFTLPGTSATGYGTLNAIYAASYASLPDNCSLTVVREYDRSVGGTYYKLMYYYEFVALVTNIALVNDWSSARYGQYQFEFTMYNASGAITGKEYVYAATADAYAKNVYYIVVPNESNVASGSNYPNVPEYNAFLSVAVAKTYAPFTATNGVVADFDSPNNAYINDGTTTYYVSKNVYDFSGVADYYTAIGLVFNTAGYVAGYTPVRGTAPTTGYLYLDSLEFSTTSAAGAQWLGQYDRAWSAQAKAQVYFPAVGGNSNYTVIDLAIKGTTAKYVDVATANDLTAVNTGAVDPYVAADKISLPTTTTAAFYDVSKTTYPWSDASNIRVYDKWYDGWYFYTINANGTYSLAPVASDVASIKKGDANLQAGSTSAALLTSTTEVVTYSFELTTKTATTVVQTGYKNIANGDYGKVDYKGNGTAGHIYEMPYIGTVGGKITEAYGKVVKVEECKTTRAQTKYDFTLFRGEYGYNAAMGQSGLKFLVAGGAEVLYLADTVYWTGVGGTTTEFKGAARSAIIASLVGSYKDTNADNVADTNVYAYQLTYENGKITAIKEYVVEKSKAVGFDVNGYVVLEGETTATNYNTASVWNYANGAVDVVATGDTVYTVNANNGGVTIDAMWVTTPGAYNDGTPNWNVPNYTGGFQWWN